MPGHKVKFDPDTELELDCGINYLPILTAVCVLIVIIYLIYKLFSKVNELNRTITELTSKLDDFSKVPENEPLFDNQLNEFADDDADAVVDPGPSGVIKDELQLQEQSDANIKPDSLKSISEDKLE